MDLILTWVREDGQWWNSLGVNVEVGGRISRNFDDGGVYGDGLSVLVDDNVKAGILGQL